MNESDALYISKLEKELKDLREQNASQLSMYEMTTLYLKKLQEDLKKSEQKLSQTNKNLMDSIQYAKYIQDAFVIQIESLQKLFPKAFIFQNPKNIVSGDFLWAHVHNNQKYIALGDCTGHGVPGAMLSIFVLSMLNQSMSDLGIYSPAEVLNRLDSLMQKYLSQYTEVIRDSAEISLIRCDENHRSIIFSGARRPLVHIRNKTLSVYRGAKYVLGNSDRRNQLLEDTEIEIQENDMIYMFSDGLADQFGGNHNTKFSSKRLLDLLLSVSDLPITQQQEIIHHEYNQWKGSNSQIDDVLLLGLKV